MKSRFNRTYENCWDNEKIRKVLEDRVQELTSPSEKSKSRMKLLRAKIAKLKNALDGNSTVGGQIAPQEYRSAARMEDRPWKKGPRRIRKICFKCRKRGHILQDCTENDGKQVCFRCGSEDHNLRDCTQPITEDLPFAICFICEKQGHLAFQCPENRHGIFPRGNGCYLCGEVTHKKVDCPHFRHQRTKLQDPYQN